MNDTVMFSNRHTYELMKAEQVPEELIARFLLGTNSISTEIGVYYEATDVNQYIKQNKKGLN